ncbi:MAG: ATP-binding cassette domain-containing protein [Bdellovibrionales bacterium]
MMNLLQLQRGYKHFGMKSLFEDASFAINEGEHVGVIGPNGAGKTTLFKILVGQESLDHGQLTMATGLRLGYLEQESEWDLGSTAESYLERHCLRPIWELKRLGHDLGLEAQHFASPLSALSGGYRMRMKLLYLIGREPQLMLLDEPTNFLDLESVLALERFLQSYSGAFLLISHDREFLRRTTESTLEVEAGAITKFPGHIDDYFEQKLQLREILTAQAANQDAKRKKIQEFVDRFRAKATKARQAQSRMKQLEKMECIELKKLPVRARIQIPPPVSTGKEVLVLSQAQLGYGKARAVLNDVDLRLERGAHVGVVGPNGAGKSTLLKALAGRLPLLEGTRELGYQVTLSYFSQHVTDQLDLNDTVLGALQSAAHREIGAQDILNLAGSLLFSGDDIHKPIRILSGGEKSRVALGQILLKRSPLLLFDEPTNHLDFETVEALTEALCEYAGTVVVVSHDRGFIGRVANRILEIHDGRVDLYPGTYDEYVWSLQKGALSQRTQSHVMRTPDSPGSLVDTVPPTKVNFKEASKQLQARIKEHQRQIRTHEERLEELQDRQEALNRDLLAAQGTQAETLARELGACAQDIVQVEEALLVAMEASECAEKELAELRTKSI